MKKYITYLLASISLTSLSAHAASLENKDLNLASTFRFRIQNRFTFETQDTKNLSGKFADISIRRARFRLEGTVWDPRLLFKFQLGLSPQDIGNDKNNLLDGAIGWRLASKTTLWVGQMKLPGNREFMTSSGDLNLVDRSIVSSRFNLDRDQGVQIHHEAIEETPLRIKLALTNGEGKNRQNEDTGMSYTGRLEYLPLGSFKDNGDFTEGDSVFELNHKLSLGTTYNSMKRAKRTSGTNGTALTADGVDLETMVFDYIYKLKGISLSGEYIKRWSNSSLVPRGDGFSSQIGKMLESSFEPVVRFSKLTGNSKLDQTTLGLNKYFNKHKLKLQNDLSYSEGTGRSYWTYRLQLEVGI